MHPKIRLAILASHPVQYYAPMFRELAQDFDLHVFYAHTATPAQQAAAGFGHAFDWDINLLDGYSHSFLTNVSKRPGTDWFGGCDTPEIYAKLKSGKFNAVLTLGWHLKSMVQGIVAAKRLGIAVMVRGDSQLLTPRSTLKKWAKAIAYPILLRVFDAALYVGKNNQAYWRHYRFPESRLFFSPHCVETKRFAEGATAEARESLRARLGIQSTAFVALFAGKLLPFKRPLDIVHALAKARAAGHDCRLLVAGSGPLEADLRELAEVLDVPLDILGFQNQSQMPAAYAAADVLILPSDGRETWGLVANEALASGTPIIVSKTVGCAPDLAADGKCAKTFNTGDYDALAAALISAMESKFDLALIAKLSENYSIRRAVEGIEAAILSTVE
jgi:glycosyltransferase involved in cell wall biosynthesis